MKFGQGADRVHELLREQPNQPRDHTRQLCITLAEVAWTVKLVEKEPSDVGVTRRHHQVGVGQRKPSLLIRLDRVHACGKGLRRGASVALERHGLQIRQDRGHVRMCDRALRLAASRKEEAHAASFTKEVSCSALRGGGRMMQHFGPVTCDRRTTVRPATFMQRRSLLKLGAGAAACLAVAGAGVAWLRPGVSRGRLSPGAAAVFHAVGRAVLDGSLVGSEAAQHAALDVQVERVGQTIAAFPHATQSELSLLLALLASAPGRIGLARLHSDWPDAATADVQVALQGMRLSTLAVRQQAYHALRDLTNAAFYAEPAAWPLMGYPGPDRV
jgi:hypothetical protein